MKPKRLLSFLFLFLLCIGCYYILSRSKYYNNEGAIFGTTYHIKYAATQDYGDEILAELEAVDDALSMFDPLSTLSRFNRNETTPPDSRFTEVITLAQRISKETNGAFDITVAPLVNAWGFGIKNKEPLSDAKIDSLRSFVGYEKLRIEGTQLLKSDPRINIDAGAIAKGYGVDRVARLLSEKGCKNFMVEIGGEIVVRGENEKGKAWSVGISKPDEKANGNANEVQETLHLRQGAIATSGNYRNYYYEGGHKYGHTIHPRTGRPVLRSLLSATVLAPTCAEADAYATSFMVMGIDAAIAFVQQHKSLSVFFIYVDAHHQLKTWSNLPQSVKSAP